MLGLILSFDKVMSNDTTTNIFIQNIIVQIDVLYYTIG